MSKEKDIMKESIEEVKETIDMFYQQKTGEALKKFNGALDRVVSIVNTLFAYREEHEGFALEENRIKETLTDAMNALEDRDMILLADILQYDFIEYVEELMKDMA